MVEIGDTWRLSFDDFVLRAQEIRTGEAPVIARALAGTDCWNSVVVDRDDVPIAVAVLALRRKPVASVDVYDDATLRLHFAPGEALVIPTDTETVDWQWAISATDNDPYHSFRVACFRRGEIAIDVDA